MNRHLNNDGQESKTGHDKVRAVSGTEGKQEVKEG
jgi:hypothetical protein